MSISKPAISLNTAHAADKLFRKVADELFPGVGCSDGNCIFGHNGGMHTNGGCRCFPLDDPFEARNVARKLKIVGLELAKRIVTQEQPQPEKSISTTTITIDNDDPEWPV